MWVPAATIGANLAQPQCRKKGRGEAIWFKFPCGVIQHSNSAWGILHVMIILSTTISYSLVPFWWYDLLVFFFCTYMYHLGLEIILFLFFIFWSLRCLFFLLRKTIMCSSLVKGLFKKQLPIYFWLQVWIDILRVTFCCHNINKKVIKRDTFQAWHASFPNWKYTIDTNI